MWHALQRIKGLREQQAQAVLQARQAELAAARRAREAAEQALQAHRRLAQDHERALYADLLRRRVRLRDIEDVQQAVAHLKRTEHGLATRREEALVLERRHEEQAAQAHQVQRAAARVKEKFDQLARLHADAIGQAAEQAQDQEIEEAAALRRDRDDWDRQDEAAA